MVRERYADAKLTLGQHTYRGRSIGSEETCHQFPGLGLCFDLGGPPISATSISQVFITHGHEDHIGGLAKHILRRDLRGMAPATYYIPEGDLDMAQAMVESAVALSRSQARYNLVPVTEATAVPVGGKLIIRPFASNHCIPCTGYTAWSEKRKLKAKYQGLAGPDLAKLRQGGVEISDNLQAPEITFPGDTSIDVLAHVPEVTQARVLLLECTFLDDEISPAKAHQAGHVHIDHILDALQQRVFQNEVLLLTHFSARYDAPTVRSLLSEKLAGVEGGPQVIPLLPN